MALTEAGARMYEHCQRIIAEAEAAEAEAGSMQTEPSGLLRLSAGVSFGQMHLARHLPALLERHPGLAITKVLNDRIVAQNGRATCMVRVWQYRPISDSA